MQCSVIWIFKDLLSTTLTLTWQPRLQQTITKELTSERSPDRCGEADWAHLAVSTAHTGWGTWCWALKAKAGCNCRKGKVGGAQKSTDTEELARKEPRPGDTWGYKAGGLVPLMAVVAGSPPLSGKNQSSWSDCFCKKQFFNIYLFAYLFIWFLYMLMHSIGHRVRVEVRGHLVGVSSFYHIGPGYWSQPSISHVWQLAPLPA